MGFHCNSCSGHKSLEIKAQIEIPPDARSDEITLQIVLCKRCGFTAIAIYEESHRGALDSELFDHFGYTIEQKEFKVLKALIKQCPEPKNRRCSCDTHLKLNRKDPSGRWIKPGFGDGKNTFPMIL